MYEGGDGHVEVLTASVRSMDHFKQALKIKSDIITAPPKIYRELSEVDVRDLEKFQYDDSELLSIQYKNIGLDKSFEDIDIHHDLTDKGLGKFANDWNSVISS